jgi:hypothetical protein
VQDTLKSALIVVVGWVGPTAPRYHPCNWVTHVEDCRRAHDPTDLMCVRECSTPTQCAHPCLRCTKWQRHLWSLCCSWGSSEQCALRGMPRLPLHPPLRLTGSGYWMSLYCMCRRARLRVLCTRVPSHRPGQLARGWSDSAHQDGHTAAHPGVLLSCA